MDKVAVAKKLLKLAELVSEGESPKFPKDTTDEGLVKNYEEIRKNDLDVTGGKGYDDYKSMNTKMSSKKAALLEEISKLAKIAEAAGPAVAAPAVRKVDPQLNSLVSRAYAVTGDDLSKMLTLIIMLMKKAGHQADANKVYTMFQAIMKKVGKDFEDLQEEA